MNYIAQDNPTAAADLDEDFEAKAELARQHPASFRTGRVPGTREIVVQPNYVIVYRIEDKGKTVAMLRVLHATQHWPPAS